MCSGSHGGRFTPTRVGKTADAARLESAAYAIFDRAGACYDHALECQGRYEHSAAQSWAEFAAELSAAADWLLVAARARHLAALEAAAALTAAALDDVMMAQQEPRHGGAE